MRAWLRSMHLTAIQTDAEIDRSTDRLKVILKGASLTNKLPDSKRVSKPHFFILKSVACRPIGIGTLLRFSPFTLGEQEDLS